MTRQKRGRMTRHPRENRKDHKYLLLQNDQEKRKQTQKLLWRRKDPESTRAIQPTNQVESLVEVTLEPSLRSANE